MSWARQALADAENSPGVVVVEGVSSSTTSGSRAAAAVMGQLFAKAPDASDLRPQIVSPGDIVTADAGALKGKGIVQREDGKLVATVCGIVERVNKLLYVRPLKHRYTGCVGDVVVGRIMEVQQERWAVEIGTAMMASLHLGAIQLPNNEQRRRCDEDTHRMRDFYEEGDIISAEVLKVGENGEILLQTRNARYGKLQNGTLVTIPSAYMPRQAQHIVTLPDIGVLTVMGNNGWVWICAPSKVIGSGRQETVNFSQMDVRYETVNSGLRERICRVRNAIVALAGQGLEVTPEGVLFVYNQSVSHGLAAWELADITRFLSAGDAGSASPSAGAAGAEATADMAA